MTKDEKHDEFVERWQEARPDEKIKASPMELLLLGTLQYLGHGWTFDDREESTIITREVHRVYLHTFVECGSKILFPMYVLVSSTLEELRDCESEYTAAGFPGCTGSTDATHIPVEKVSYGQRQARLGFKSASTTRTYYLTVNHRCKILHSTQGHPGRWNNKTLVRFDGFMHQLCKGDLNKTMSFKLEVHDSSITVNGAYDIVDNGYLQWPSTVPPLKNSCNRSEIRFSQWLESLRKDVECSFGILKGRWRILKTGVRLHNTKVCDSIWLTCCALHYTLLDVDGLSERATFQNAFVSWLTLMIQMHQVSVGLMGHHLEVMALLVVIAIVITMTTLKMLLLITILLPLLLMEETST